MKTFNTIVKRRDTQYGGYDFIEYNMNGKYQTGNSRSFVGHYIGDSVDVMITRKLELVFIEEQLIEQGYTKTN